MPNPLSYQIKPFLCIFSCRYSPTSPLSVTVPSFLIVAYIISPISSLPTHFSPLCNLASTPTHISLKCHLSKSPTTSLAKPYSDFSIFLLLGPTVALDDDNFFLEILTLLNVQNSVVSWFFLLCIFNCNTLSWRLYKGI